MKRVLIVIASLYMSAFVATAAFAQSSPTLQVGDPSYRAIDRLRSVGLIDNIILGQRPFTYDEIARILIEARSNFDRIRDPEMKIQIERVLSHWEKEYAHEIEIYKTGSRGSLEIHALETLYADAYYLTGPSRGVFDNGLGTVNASVRPITAFGNGKHDNDGLNYSFESFHWMRAPFVTFYAHPRFQFQIPKGANTEPENEVFVQELYGKFGVNNFELEVGRDQVAWGQGEFGGMAFSIHPRPLDYVKISSPHPFRLPWVFDALGNFKGAMLVSNFGPEYNYKYTYFTTWRLSWQPVELAEFGFYYGFLMGGRGAPKSSTEDIFKEFFGFIPGVSNSKTPGNKLGGFDFRVRIPPLSGLEAYGEVYFEDSSINHPEVMFRDMAAYLGGLYLPRFATMANSSLRIEYKHTSPSTYRNVTWPSGFEISGEFLGDPLGPDGDGIYATYYYDFANASRFIARFAWERRGGDFYALKPDGSFRKTGSQPSEDRIRGIASFEKHVSRVATTRLFFGYEAASNFNFIPNNSKSALVGGVQLSFNLDI